MISSVCVHRYGDNVDTDTIIPGRYLTLRRPEELAGRDRVDVDLAVGAFFFGAKRFDTPALPPVIQAIVDAQGLVPYIVNKNKRRSADGSNR